MAAEEPGSAAGCDPFIYFFFISFKGISFKKAALIRNLPGQNEITAELRVAKSSNIAGESEAAAYTISLSSHVSFYLIYLAPYIPFSSPALTALALYPSSTYSSTHIQLYLPSHHYKYPIHPSLPIYLSSERPFPFPPSYIHTYIYTHAPPSPSVHLSSAECSPPLPFHPHYPSPHVSFYLPAHPSRPLTRRMLLCSIYYPRAHGILLWITGSAPYQAAGPFLPLPGSPGDGIERERRWEKVL